MNVDYSILTKLKLGVKLIGHRLVGYRLSTNELRVVDTSAGAVRGRKRRTVYDDEYHSFEGIPYALPPLGALRFRAPQPAPAWTDVRDCTNGAGKPVQENFVTKAPEGSEDCLQLNVYVKNVAAPQRLPVMVWFFGGGFNYGEATRDFYSPDYLMRADIVLVTVNYRIGALGFLSLSDPDVDVPGNAGLKDQLLALQWIRDNIAGFGGDPGNVTIFGESAGAASAHFMMLADKTKGLFHKAILMSGSALCPWASAGANTMPLRLAQSLGYTGSDNDKEVYRFLVAADVKKIACARNLLTREERVEHVLFPFSPVVEPYESDSALLTRPFVELQRTTWSNEIPIIMGGTSFEGLFGLGTAVSFPYLLDEYGDGVAVLPEEVRRRHSREELLEMAATLKRLHFGEKKPCMSDALHEFLDLLSYKYFCHANHRTLLARLQYAPTQPTYLYRFDFDSPHFNHFRMVACGAEWRGVSHGDDLSYMFYHLMSSKLDQISAEFKTITRLVGFWTAFACTSNPNGSAAEITWPAVEPINGRSPEQKPKCLNISHKLEILEVPEEDKLRVWDSFYSKEALY